MKDRKVAFTFLVRFFFHLTKSKGKQFATPEKVADNCTRKQNSISQSRWIIQRSENVPISIFFFFGPDIEYFYARLELPCA